MQLKIDALCGRMCKFGTVVPAARVVLCGDKCMSKCGEHPTLLGGARGTGLGPHGTVGLADKRGRAARLRDIALRAANLSQHPLRLANWEGGLLERLIQEPCCYIG